MSGSAHRVGPTEEVVAVRTTPEAMETLTAATVSAAGASFPIRPRRGQWPRASPCTPRNWQRSRRSRTWHSRISPSSRCPAAGSWWPGPGAGGGPTARTATPCCTTQRGRPSPSICSATGSRMCWRPSPARSGSATSAKESAATTAGAGLIARIRSACTGSPGSPRLGGRLALPEVHRGRPVGRGQRLLRPHCR
jgi:hypothetical protein